jgi:hypothetical protein
MRKLKGRDCKLPLTILLFLLRYREASRFPLVLVGAPRKSQAPGRVTPWIALGLSLRTNESMRWPLLDRSLSSSLSSFQPKHRGPYSLRYMVTTAPQTRLVWSCKTTSPSEYNNDARNHQVVRGMQTSLINTRPT